MRNPNGCRVLLLLLPPLLLAFLAALTNILENVSKDSFQNNLDRNMRSGAYQVTLSRPGSTDTIVPMDINDNPIYVILGLCTLAYAVALLSAAGIWQLRRTEGTAGHERKWTWVILLTNIVMEGASLGVFAYATSVQSSDKSWRSYEDAAQDDQEHTRETWACQINRFSSPGMGWAGTACGITKAMRFLCIAMAVVALFAFVSLWVLVRARGGVKWVFGGKGRYAGFANVYEMRPPGEVSPYVGPPLGQQWVQHPGQQWIGQPGQQQWVGQPGQQQWVQQPYQQGGMQPVQQWGPQPGVQENGSQLPKNDTTVEQRPVFG